MRVLTFAIDAQVGLRKGKSHFAPASDMKPCIHGFEHTIQEVLASTFTTSPSTAHLIRNAARNEVTSHACTGDRWEEKKTFAFPLCFSIRVVRLKRTISTNVFQDEESVWLLPGTWFGSLLAPCPMKRTCIMSYKCRST